MSNVTTTAMDVLADKVAANAKEIATAASERDVFYLLVCSVLVFMMQAGFAVLEAGVVRSKNVRNILFKNMVDACLGGLMFWAVGYGIAYGSSDDNGFIGEASGDGKHSFFFSVEEGDDQAADGKGWIGWLFQYCFAAAATTIVSGAVAGRCSLTGYLIYSVTITGVIYPVVVHWVWDSEGWISAFNADSTGGGMMDFAGSGVVHMTGGVAGLMGAIILGPRKGRFDGDGKDFSAHSAPLQTLGTMLLWAGWYGFNCGSTLGIATYARDAARVGVTTTLSACAGGVMAAILVKAITKKWDFGFMCNGILAGLVGITAGCSVVTPFCSVIIGLLSGMLVVGTSLLLKKLQVDDPLDAFAVHGACGFWGVLAVGLFATDDYTYNLKEEAGLFYGGGVIGVQLLGLLVEILWVVVTTGALFGAMRAAGILRVSAEVEEAGLDVSEHESAAYSIVAVAGGAPLVKGGVALTSPAKVAPLPESADYSASS